MSVIQTRATAATIATLRTRVRDVTGDVDTSTANQRWADAKIDLAITDTMFWMYNRLSIDPAVYSLTTTMTYTGLADSVAMPAATQSNPIIKIEDYDDTAHPQPMQRADIFNIETWDDLMGPRRGAFVWTIQDTNLLVRPRPGAAKTLRIYYVGNPWTIVGAATPATDQHPLPVAYEELIALGAAKRLMRTDDETPPQVLADYADLAQDFEIYAARYRGPMRIRSRRRWR